MTGYVWRRSALALGLLAALLAAAGGVLVVLGLPVWVPVAISLVVVVAQWALGPLLISWLIPAREIGWDGASYATDHVLGEIVARRCRDAGVRPVRLGIVDDGTPNAFTFGHTRRDARVYVTRGLLERLDERQLDAVVSHEIGHVKHNDVVVMAVVSTIPLVLYYAWLTLRSNIGQQHLFIPAVVAWLGYLLSQLAVLAVSRARELGADHWSCEVTGDGDALCSALVAIGYGMGQVDAERAALAKEAMEAGNKRAARRIARGNPRARAAGMLGIADPAQSSTVLAATEQGLEPREVMGALRWDAASPWARVQQLLSTHPLVLRRLAALETSGLPGAPQQWHASEVAATCHGPDLTRARARFPFELVVRLAPWVAGLVVVLGWGRHDGLLVTQAAAALGVAVVVRALLVYRPGVSVPVDRVASLLERLDAGPVTGLPVSLRGRVTGRGMPGYVLSPDVVVQDDSGFVAVRYRQPWPLARSVFGLLRVPALQGQEVLVRGWNRRAPGPVLELRDLVPAEGARVRGWRWVAEYVVGVVLAVVGALAWYALTR